MAESLDDDHVSRMFAAVERGDMAAFSACFVPGAAIWHNNDCAEQDVATVALALSQLAGASSSISYEEQRVAALGNVRFVQHVLVADLRSGGRLHLPVIMRIDLADNGKVVRIEEYFDSRATDLLAAA